MGTNQNSEVAQIVSADNAAVAVRVRNGKRNIREEYDARVAELNDECERAKTREAIDLDAAMRRADTYGPTQQGRAASVRETAQRVHDDGVAKAEATRDALIASYVFDSGDAALIKMLDKATVSELFGKRFKSIQRQIEPLVKTARETGNADLVESLRVSWERTTELMFGAVAKAA